MKKISSKIKVLVALSGGVDSSVAAALLVASGKYDVTAAYMINYDNGKGGNESCWRNDYRDAVRVAAHLQIPLLKFDFTKEYKEAVLDYMFREYEAGRTPNPDVLCNTFIKFGAWLQKTRELGFEYLATGHYARREPGITNSQFPISKLLESKDKNKDQTYFLHQLNQEQLSHTMFPVGKYTKPQVRKLAKMFGLPTADRPESMGICFVGEVPMKEFLEKQIARKVGNIVLSPSAKERVGFLSPSAREGVGGEGVMGQHSGLSFYTIGERHIGVKSNENKPFFVVAKKPDTNELVVGFDNDALLYKKDCEIADVHWTSGQTPLFPLKCEVRLRHRQPLQKAIVVNSPLEGGGGMLAVQFSKSQRAVTPGQFAVFYKKGECLGGGVIL